MKKKKAALKDSPMFKKFREAADASSGVAG
jgi:hypothetical protein